MSIFDRAAGIARRFGPLGAVPAKVIETYGQGVETTEQVVLRILRSRLDAVAPAAQPGATAPVPGESPSALMSGLLERSLEQDTADSKRDVQVAILRQLVPDEARIIAALAQGPPAPLIHVLPRAGGARLMENASLVGRTAALTLPSNTPAYVTHLRQLGLVETGPEDPQDKQGYELLMADRDVRAALKEGELSKLPARVVRRTLHLSDRGRELWEACSRPPGGAAT
jgi:hypothetical protein